MKRFLLSTLAFLMAFTSLGIDASAKENSVPVDDVSHIVIDAQGMTMEELQESMTNSRAATDEYYSLVSLQYTSSEFLGNTERLSKWIDKGSNLATLSLAVVLLNNPLSYAGVVYFWNDTMIEVRESKIYNQVNTYYYKYANGTYNVKDALGNHLRTVTYTNLKIATKVERKIS